MLAFEHIIILKNPKSTSIKLANKHVQEVLELFKDTPSQIIETSQAAPQTYAKLVAIKEKLGSKTLLCVAGGDGTVNRAVEFLQSHPELSAEARKTVLLPLWAGNANDLAHMLNGPIFRMRLPLLFEEAAVVATHPLVCTLIDSGGHRHVYHAASYAGFGMSAAVARVLNDRGHRERWQHRALVSRIMDQAVIVWRTLRDFNGFEIEENGQLQSLHERSYVNGSRMGKVYPLAADLTDRTFLQTTVHAKDKHIFAFYRWARGSIRFTASKATLETSTFVTKDDILMQCDGEPVKIKKGTQINVRNSDIPLFVLSSRLKQTKPDKSAKKQ